MQNKLISIAMAGTYANSGKYMPMIKKLQDKLCFCYGIGFTRKYRYSDEPLDKMRLTKIPTRVSWFLVQPICKLFHLPLYYGYWCIQRLFDQMNAQRIANDDSKVVFTSPLLVTTVEKAKKAGKIVVVEAGNSEPIREHNRIMDEYQKYGIKARHIYGDPRYGNTCKSSYDMADYIITISKVSRQTYIDAGYPVEKLKLIPLTGTDFPINTAEDGEREDAFITTAFHNFIKGTQRLLLAWKESEVKKHKLYVVGKLCEDMVEFVEKYGPFDNVVFVGHRSDLREWYKQFNAVGILLSLSEGAVRVTPEMMSYGFPMIVTEDATCDIVKDGNNGFVVDYRKQQQITEKIQYFDEDWNRVKRMKDNVIQSVTKRTMKDFSVELADFLQSLL